MSTTNKSAALDPRAPRRARSRRRHWVFLAGAGAGWALAQLAGTLLDGELAALRLLFLPLSALAGGAAALGTATHIGGLADGAKGTVRRRRLRVALAVLALGATLLIGLYAHFAVRVPFGAPGQSRAFLVGWSRSGVCECSVDDGLCIQEMGLDPSRFRSCWNGRGLVALVLALSYVLTLGSGGTVAGLLMAAADRGASSGNRRSSGTTSTSTSGSIRGPRASTAPRPGAAPRGSRPRRASPSPRLRRRRSLPRRGRRPPGRIAARRTPSGGASPEQVGDELFRTVFQGELLKAFQGCLAKARGGPGLRIRLRLNDVPQLAGLPWEYLYDAEGRGFLALSGRTPVVRYLELSEGLEHAAGRAAAAGARRDLDPARLPRARRGGRGVAAARRGAGAAPARAA